MHRYNDKLLIGVPRVTKLLRKGFAEDYGDIDVLAWKPGCRRVLAIECKDVQYKKTAGEIAEQLADFRGEEGPDGKPDLLLRHLRRIDLILQHRADVAHYVGLQYDPQLEGHLVFKNPVPMQFAWERMQQKVKLHVLENLAAI